MITSIRIKNFKKFDETTVNLDDGETLFVGQNNGGKTTALQALTLWGFLVKEWNKQKGKSKAKNRTGVQVTRNALSAIPVKDMRYIWKDGQIKEGSRSSPLPVEIEVFGKNHEGIEWRYGIQLTYGSKETIYCKPIGDEELPEDIYNIFQLPPLSGVQTDEKRLLLGAQLKVIGEGRPGEILRTLLWELYSEDYDGWKDIQSSCKELFGINLQKISFNEATDAYIEILYVPVDNQESRSKNKSKKKTVTMEISSLGSGTLQFLLLSVFMYKHKNSLILLDEPDSHMHVFLQKRTYEWIRLTARKNNCQVIIATHSEVLIDAANLESVVGFFGKEPKSLPKRDINPLLKNVSSVDLIHATWKNIFYSEGDTDLRILRAFAEVLEHPVLEKLETPFHYDFSVHEFEGDGTNHLTYVKKHFSALKNVRQDFKGICIRDAGQNLTEDIPTGLEVYYWKLPEIENYLIHPEAIIRFLSLKLYGGISENMNRDLLRKSIPEVLFEDPFKQEGILGKGSDFLARYLKSVNFDNTSKGDFYEIALCFQKEEVFPEIQEILDKLQKVL